MGSASRRPAAVQTGSGSVPEHLLRQDGTVIGKLGERLDRPPVTSSMTRRPTAARGSTTSRWSTVCPTSSTRRSRPSRTTPTHTPAGTDSVGPTSGLRPLALRSTQIVPFPSCTTRTGSRWTRRILRLSVPQGRGSRPVWSHLNRHPPPAPSSLLERAQEHGLPHAAQTGDEHRLLGLSKFFQNSKTLLKLSIRQGARRSTTQAPPAVRRKRSRSCIRLRRPCQNSTLRGSTR